MIFAKTWPIVARLAGGPERHARACTGSALESQGLLRDMRHSSVDRRNRRARSCALKRRGPGNALTWETIDSAKVKLRARKPGETYTQTFRSSIDGSVQYYAVVPALPAPDGRRPGLVLTLHGAAVEGLGQAACYSRKPGHHCRADQSPALWFRLGRPGAGLMRLKFLSSLKRHSRPIGSAPI